MTKKNEINLKEINLPKLVQELKSAATYAITITEKQSLENFNKLITGNPLIIPCMQLHFQPYYQELLKSAKKNNNHDLIKNLEIAQIPKLKKIKILPSEKKEIESIFKTVFNLNKSKMSTVLHSEAKVIPNRPTHEQAFVIQQILRAMTENDFTTLESLLTQGIPEQINGYLPVPPNLPPAQYTLLHVAVNSPVPPRIFECIVKACNQEVRGYVDGNGETALHIAAELGDLKKVEILMPAMTKKQIDQPNHNGVPAVIKAAMRGHGKIIATMINIRGEELLQTCTTGGLPLFNAAAAAGFESSIKVLLQVCPDDHLLKEYESVSPLCSTIVLKQSRAAILLIRSLKEKNLLTAEIAQQAFRVAVEQNCVDILCNLIEIAGKKHFEFIQEDLNLIKFVIENEFKEVFKLLFTTFSPLLSKEKNKISTLSIAIILNQLEMVKYLLSLLNRNAIGEKVGDRLYTPLMIAASNDSFPMVKFLISQFENHPHELEVLLNDIDSIGMTCLDRAVAESRTEIVEFLVGIYKKNKFILKLTDYKLGSSMLHDAMFKNNIAIAKTLINNLDTDSINKTIIFSYQSFELSLEAAKSDLDIMLSNENKNDQGLRTVIENLRLELSRPIMDIRLKKLATPYFKLTHTSKNYSNYKIAMSHTEAFFQHKTNFSHNKKSPSKSDKNVHGAEYKMPNSFHYSIILKNLAMVSLLLESGKVDVNKFLGGATALHFAVLSRSKKLVELLLQYNADPFVKEKESGKNALQMAKALYPAGHRIIQCLRNRIAEQITLHPEYLATHALGIAEELKESEQELENQKQLLPPEIETCAPTLAGKTKSTHKENKFSFFDSWNQYTEFARFSSAVILDLKADLLLAESQKEKSRRYRSSAPSDEKLFDNPQKFYLSASTKKELEAKHYYLLGPSSMETSKLPIYVHVNDDVIKEAIKHGVWDDNKAQLQKGVQFTSEDSDRGGIKKLADDLYELANKGKGRVGNSRLWTTEPMAERNILINGRKIKALVLTFNHFASSHDELQRKIKSVGR